MNWLYYLGEANLYLIIFYIGYCLFLSKQTHFTLSRIYLLSGCVFAFVLPVLQLTYLKRDTWVPASATDFSVQPKPTLWQQGLLLIYILGVCLFTALFIVKLFKLWILIRKSHTSKINDHTTIELNGCDTAFSFFNYLFIAGETKGVDLITQHELVHIRQKHSVDIIFTEILKIVSWFNPVLYLLQRSLKNVHEFIADEKTAAINNDRLEYSAFLISNAYGLSGSAITHSFFNSNLLKRRILMLNGKRSGKLSACKYLLIAPLFAGMLCISTLSFSKSYGWVEVSPLLLLPAPPQHSPQPIRDEPQKPSEVIVLKAPPPPATAKGEMIVNGITRHINTNAPKPHVAQPLKAKKKAIFRYPPPEVVPDEPADAQTDKRLPPPPPQPPASKTEPNANNN